MSPQRQPDAVIDAAWEQYSAAMAVNDARELLERANTRLVRAKAALARISNADGEVSASQVETILEGAAS